MKRIPLFAFFSLMAFTARDGVAGPGAWDQTYAPSVSGGAVYATALQPDGKLIIGGGFTTVNASSARNHLARLVSDGSLDSSFFSTGSGVSSTVWALALQSNGSIVIGGDFTSINSTSRVRLARLNPNGTVDGSFLPTNTINNSVLAVAVQTNNAVVIGGTFSGGTFPSYSARLNADGSTDTSFSSYPNGPVYAVAIQTDGRIVIGGSFTTVNGATRYRIARLNSDGSLDNTFQNGLSGASSSVRCLQIQSDGRILIGGDFTTVNGSTRSYVARLTGTGALDPGFAATAGANAAVYAVSAQPDSSVVIGGAFSAYGSANLSRLARLYADGTRDTTFTNFGINNIVQTVAVQSDGGLLIGGTFTTIDNTNWPSLGRLYGNVYPPEFLVQPVSRATNVGANVTFSAQVGNPTSPSFQWRKEGNNISGATGTSYSLYNVQFADAGNYSVFVSDAVGGLTSSNAVLQVGLAPALTSQPSSLTVTQGQSATFSITATGTPLNYFWRKNAAFIPGQTNSSLVFAAVTPANVGTYSCQVSNFLGSVTSTGAVLTIAYPPAITLQPASQTIGVGSNFTVSATATGNPAPAYQWRTNGVPIAGAMASSYTVTGAQTTDSGNYDVVVTNSVGATTSSVAVITVVYFPPTITTQPVGGNVAVSNSFTLSASAIGTAPFAWQWRANGLQIPGAVSNLYVVSSAQLTDAGSYDVVVANSVGSATSSVAVVSVGYPPVVLQQPVSLTNALGGTATFSCLVTGSVPITLQWQLNSNAIPGATNAMLVLTNLQAGDSGSYALSAQNAFGGTVSSNALLDLMFPPTITTQPVGGNVAVSNSLTLSATAAGTAPLAWRWRANGVQIPGALSNLYVISSARLTDAGSYDVVVANSAGSVTSSVAVVNVGYPPVVLQQPVSLTNFWGGTASFSCVVTGTAPITLQWQLNSSAIPGATNTVLMLTNLQPSDMGWYALTATNGYGGTVSSNAELILEGLNIYLQPAPILVNPTNFGLDPSRFSTRLALSGDELAVGQALNGGTGALAPADSGLIHIFSIQSNSLAKLNTLMSPDTVYDAAAFGTSLGLEGAVLYAGTPNTFRNGAHDGTAYLYANIAASPTLVSEWTELPSQWAGYFGSHGCLVEDALVVSQGSNPSYGSRAGAFFYRVDAAGNRSSVFSFMADDTDRDVEGLALSSNRCAVVWNSRADSNNCQLLVFDLNRDGTNGFNALTTNTLIAVTNFVGGSLLGTACDGDLVAVGEPLYAAGTNQWGRVRLWRLGGGTASLIAVLYPPDLYSGGNYGECVCLKNNTLIVGSPTAPWTGGAQGCAYIYNIPPAGQPGSPARLQPPVPVIGSGEYFGNPIVWDGSRVIIGSSGGNERSGIGTVYLYDARYLSQPAVPTLTISRTGTGTCSLNLAGMPGASYVLQSSPSLTPPSNWQPLLTNTMDTNGLWQYLETNLNTPKRFYRATTP